MSTAFSKQLSPCRTLSIHHRWRPSQHMFYYPNNKKENKKLTTIFKEIWQGTGEPTTYQFMISDYWSEIEEPTSPRQRKLTRVGLMNNNENSSNRSKHEDIVQYFRLMESDELQDMIQADCTKRSLDNLDIEQQFSLCDCQWSGE